MKWFVLFVHAGGLFVCNIWCMIAPAERMREEEREGERGWERDRERMGGREKEKEWEGERKRKREIERGGREGQSCITIAIIPSVVSIVQWSRSVGAIGTPVGWLTCVVYEAPYLRLVVGAFINGMYDSSVRCACIVWSYHIRLILPCEIERVSEIMKAWQASHKDKIIKIMSTVWL